MKKIFLLSSILLSTIFINASAFADPVAATPSATNPAITAPPAASNPGFITPAAPELDAKSFILVDASSGAVLAEKNADDRLAPASLTKLMSLYIIFQELNEGRIKLTDMVTISKDAWKTGGSRMFVQVDTQVQLEDLLRGIIVASGNDATVALSEYVAGTQDAFAQLMDQQAKNLGMNNSNYTDATGLPDPNHYSTARDFSTLSVALIQDFPQYYHYFSEQWFTYNNIRQPNRNSLLWSNLGVDGLKTGHTDDAGYCLIGSAKQNDMRLVAIVMGTKSEKARAAATQALLQYGFRYFKTQKFFTANESIAKARVYSGATKYIDVGSSHDIAVTLPTNATQNMTTDIKLNKSLRAPIAKGQEIGTLTIMSGDKVVGTQPLVALVDTPRGGLWRRFIDFFAGMFH